MNIFESITFFFLYKIPTKLIQISAFLKVLNFFSSNMLASTMLIKPALPKVFRTIPFW